MKKLDKAFERLYLRPEKAGGGFLDFTDELYYSDEVQSLCEFEQHLDINRLQHITAVAVVSVSVCKRLGLDCKSAARGAVMHDLFYYDWRDGVTGKWHRLHGYRHPRFSLLNARELCDGLTHKEENIILRHMWPLTPIPPKYAEGFVVSLADKYCAMLELLFSLGLIGCACKSKEYDLA